MHPFYDNYFVLKHNRTVDIGHRLQEPVRAKLFPSIDTSYCSTDSRDGDFPEADNAERKLTSVFRNILPIPD